MPGITDTARTISFSQSALGTYLVCPQQLGFELAGTPVGITSSDATELGTALHTAIECTMDPQRLPSEHGSAYDYAREWLVTQAETGQFLWKKSKTLPTLLNHFDACWSAFCTEVFPKLGAPLSIERTFDVPLVTAPDGTLIRLKGTWDYEDTNLGLLDGKTAGREWDRGKHRGRIQTAAYTYAWAMFDRPDVWNSDPVDFTYVVHIKGARPSSVQMLTDSAGPPEWRWLQHLALRVYDNMGTDVWALNDTTPLCSELWCDFWSHCKGAVLAGEET